MENTLNLKKNIVMIFVTCIMLYILMWGMFYRPSSSPIILKTTQDSLCVTPQGWPIPCPPL